MGAGAGSGQAVRECGLCAVAGGPPEGGRMTPKPIMLWGTVHFAALDHLPRAVAAMGFDRSAGPMPRGGIPVFPTTYQRHRPWLARYPGRVVPEMAATWDAAARARAAETNRGIL